MTGEEQDIALARGIAEVTHDDWLANRDLAPEWFIEVHERGLCLMPTCQGECDAHA